MNKLKNLFAIVVMMVLSACANLAYNGINSDAEDTIGGATASPAK